LISALLVKELREKSGAGMMDAKKALLETDGDLEAAQDWLRTKGLLKAEKKSSRIAADGLVGVRVHENEGMMIELNSETDFVATNKEFTDLLDLILDQGFGITDKDKLLNKSISGKNIQEIINNKIATIGENISLRRVISIKGSNIYSYLHNSVSKDCGKIGVLVSLEGNKDEDFGKKLAMHIAATSPLAMSENDLDADLVDREKKIISEQLISEGKPAHIADKILLGKLKKFYEENTLLNQKFVMDPDSSIRQVLEKNNQVLINFVRFKVGEGLEKKESDFATEVKDIIN
jgi:elongation factor Ts